MKNDKTYDRLIFSIPPEYRAQLASEAAAAGITIKELGYRKLGIPAQRAGRPKKSAQTSG